MDTKRDFVVRRGDEWISVYIRGEVATLVVAGIDDVGILIEALNRALAAGATRGIMFTGEVVDDHAAAMHTMRARAGITWMGGKVSLLGQRPNGPEFRIDWDVLPAVTE